MCSPFAHDTKIQVVAAYGFMHPIIPPCPSAEEYRRRSEDWQRRAERLEGRLNVLYGALEQAEMDLEHLYEYLRSCDGCRNGGGGFEKSQGRTRNRTDDDYYLDDDNTPRLRHEHVRGAAHVDREAASLRSSSSSSSGLGRDDLGHEVRHGSGSRRSNRRRQRTRDNHRHRPHEPARSEF